MRTYAVAASTALRDRTAYAGNFSASMLTYGLFVFVFSRVWAGAYAGQSEIAGYTRAMVVWYFIIAEITSFGFGRYFQGLARDVKNGQVAYLLARPYDFVTYHYAERVGGSLVDAGIVLVEGLLMGLLVAGPLPPIDPGQGSVFITVPGKTGLLALSLILAGSLNFYLQFSLALTAFWLEENDALYWIFQKFSLIVGTLVPIEFLPEKAARLALWTPFPYLSYAPARIFVDFSWVEAVSLISRQAVWLVLAVVLARVVFALGSRHVSMNGG